MIFFIPIVPIIIAILLLALGLITEISSAINTIITVVWIILAVFSIIIIICNFFRKTTIGHKIAGSIFSIIATIISLVESKTFLFGLAGSSDTSSLTGTIEFGFVLIFGGLIWLSCVFLCAYASFACIDEDPSYVIAIACIAGSLILGNIFGLLS